MESPHAGSTLRPPMKTLNYPRLFLGALVMAVVFVAIASAQNPGQHWLRYKTPEQAGWSSERLTTICRNSNANAVLLVQSGKIVYAYGEYWRRIKCHSMRKSFLSALYGIYIERGMIDTGKTIAQLAITNSPSLTENEKKAQIVDLLTCRSGIYLPSGQETEEMVRSRPERGSHLPGTYWYYNNWDFNALGTIFRSVTGKDIFEAFKSDIANPLRMEDFRLIDGVYEFEPPDTSHPGYLFKMSDRTFAVDNTYNMYIEFGRDENGVVNRIIGHYYRDSFDETYRTK
jgi:CubicO group peptidase (beta-lactamase class C family)